MKDFYVNNLLTNVNNIENLAETMGNLGSNTSQISFAEIFILTDS